MSVDYLAIGHFSNAATAAAAIEALRAQGHDENITYYSPFPDHHLEEAAFQGKPRSNVRRWTLIGGLIGCLGAFLFTCWMSIDYPLRVSAKPIVGIPSFVVIAFECTVLLGGICTLIGMFWHARLIFVGLTPGYRPDFSEGAFGVTVRIAKEHADELKLKLQKLGAYKVEVQYVR